METENVFTGWIIRFGGLVPTYYISGQNATCHASNATVFMSKAQAEHVAIELQKEYTCGVSVKKA